MKTLGEHAAGRDNNFNLIRMIAASSVLLSHSWPIADGPQALEPLRQNLGFSLGTIAVLIFFAISGFFIAQSFDRSKSLMSFFTARILRIYPALLAVLFLTTLILGPIFSTYTLPQYFAAAGTFSYIPKNLLLYNLQYGLPGVFESHPFGAAINGSLWTLFYEVSCYGGVVVCGCAGLLSPRRYPVFLFLFLGFLLVIGVIAPGNPAIGHIRMLPVAFVIGMTFYVYRSYIVLSPVIALATVAAAALAYGSPTYRYAFIFAVAYLSFWLGHVGWLGQKQYNRLGDYSYGMYIFAFPIQQIMVSLLPDRSPLALAGVSFAATLPLAVLSWYLVERPMLAQRSNVTAFLRQYGERRGLKV